MKMTAKIMRSRAHAQTALDAYRSNGGQDADDIAAISDLIADLLHLADKDEADEPEGADGEQILSTSLSHWLYERDPANADDEV